MAKKRITYEISYDSEIFGRRGGWVLKKHGVAKPIDKWGTKKEAIHWSTRRLRMDWFYEFIRSELIIKNKDGRISKDKRTYGNDPREIKG